MLDNIAPTPADAQRSAQDGPNGEGGPVSTSVAVTIAGCGGCGMNLARPFLNGKNADVLYFDTSLANSRFGESVNILGNRSGSGSNRAENAREIESAVAQLPDNEMSLGQVAIVVFSLAGGSGSVIGPMLMREYHRRGVRVIGVIVAEAGSSVGARNTLNTLKTLTAIAKNNDLYMPLIVLSNDEAVSRQTVDEAANVSLTDLIDILVSPVYEIDRNDRLNWINPTKIVSTQPGLKLLTLLSDKKASDPKALLGTESTEMVDSMLILQSNGVEQTTPVPPARLKKTGFYNENSRTIIGKVSSDITAVDTIINRVEKMDQTDKAQKYQPVSRLSTSDDSDLIL